VCSIVSEVKTLGLIVVLLITNIDVDINKQVKQVVSKYPEISVSRV